MITDYRNELKLLRTRLEAAEREISALRSQRQTLASVPLQCRLCRTAEVDTYPSSSGNTFGLIFVELAFTKEEGTQTQTLTDRSASAQGIGQTADGAFVPEGTLCLAVEQANGQYLLLPLECE